MTVSYLNLWQNLDDQVLVPMVRRFSKIQQLDLIIVENKFYLEKHHICFSKKQNCSEINKIILIRQMVIRWLIDWLERTSRTKRWIFCNFEIVWNIDRQWIVGWSFDWLYGRFGEKIKTHTQFSQNLKTTSFLKN